MRRRELFQTIGGVTVGTLLGSLSRDTLAAASRPNVLWIIGEDLCPDLGCYGHPLVTSPEIDRLASQGMRFTNAFTTAPVCSASRSALITGMYQTSIGAHHHRSHRDDGYRLPERISLVTEIFRQAGYFTANVTTAAPGVKGTGKTDFNFNVENPFDGTDWNQRAPGQPFYAQVNFPETHRRFKKATENSVDPADVDLPPYYPDHPIVREDWALYLDTVQHLDNKVGAVLRRLDEEGLSENTIVFFFADHGRPHVRGKQWLYDGGIHVPLIVRWPGKIKPGTVNDQLVSAIDITATSLDLVGIDVPDSMEGQVFLGPRATGREYIVAARDRCDETVDRIRCVRTKEFKYIRNFMPNRPYLQLNRYKESEYPVIRLMRRLHAEKKLTPEQERFLADTRPKEELYHLENDPHELNNLTQNPDYREQLEKMRRILAQWIERTDDHGETPEDPSIAKKYEEKMKGLYDKRIEKRYREEGMEY